MGKEEKTVKKKSRKNREKSYYIYDFCNGSGFYLFIRHSVCINSIKVPLVSGGLLMFLRGAKKGTLLRNILRKIGLLKLTQVFVKYHL